MPCDTMAYPPPPLLPRPPPPPHHDYSPLFGGAAGFPNHSHAAGFPGLPGLGPTNSFATPATGLPGLCAPPGMGGFYSGRFPPFPFGGGLRPPMPPEDDNVKVSSSYFTTNINMILIPKLLNFNFPASRKF